MMKTKTAAACATRTTARDLEKPDDESNGKSQLHSTSRDREADGFRAGRLLIHDARRAMRWKRATATNDDALWEAIATRSALDAAAKYLLKREKRLRLGRELR